MATANQFGIVRLSFFQSGKMFLRNHQHMRRCLRIDVFKGINMLVFVNFLGGNLAAKNAAEKAIIRSVAHGCFLLNHTSAITRPIANLSPVSPQRPPHPASEFQPPVSRPDCDRHPVRAPVSTSLPPDSKSSVPSPYGSAASNDRPACLRSARAESRQSAPPTFRLLLVAPESPSLPVSLLPSPANKRQAFSPPPKTGQLLVPE